MRKAFTLVELIVVITILAILATIAYISLIGYGFTARDAVRVSDIGSITKVVELYKLQAGEYPPVSESVNVSFSGAIIWEQGSFGDETRKFAQRISETPIDPLTFNNYAYSKTVSTGEYQIGTIVEKDATIGYFPVNPVVLQTHAVDASNILQSFATTLVKGNYNGKFITYKQGNNIYILGAPSILANVVLLQNQGYILFS